MPRCADRSFFRRSVTLLYGYQSRGNAIRVITSDSRGPPAFQKAGRRHSLGRLHERYRAMKPKALINWDELVRRLGIRLRLGRDTTTEEHLDVVVARDHRRTNRAGGIAPAGTAGEPIYWLIKEGDAARNRRDWHEAARLYGLVVKAKPSFHHIRVQLGHAYKELGDFDNASVAYRTVMHFTPFDDDLHLQIGHLQKRKGNTRQAAAAYRKSAELNPANTNAVTEYLALAPVLGLPLLLSPSDANEETLAQAHAARVANGKSPRSSLLGPVLAQLSARIAPLVRAELGAALVAELNCDFNEQLLSDELHGRVEEIVARELPERVEAIIARELPERVEAIIARELPERVEAIIARELPERVEAIVAHALAGKQSQVYRPNDIVAGSFPGEYMAASNVLARDFLHSEYEEFCRIFKEPLVLHRKLWEWAFIYERLKKVGVLRPGMRGLGFGVGTEKLPAVFASLGAHITATDAPIGQNWDRSADTSDHKNRLFKPDIIDRESFDGRVSFEYYDMNDISSSHLIDYDFCWSSCSFEHLGSLQHGLDFVINSIERSLKMGGVACHTTELNLSSDDETIGTGPTVFYRKNDLKRLCQILEGRGHWVEPLRIEPGALPPDYFVDVPPYSSNPHLKLLAGSYIVTSVGLVVRRGK
jgi:tetratricopeptide (TPR) repeat protein